MPPDSDLPADSFALARRARGLAERSMADAAAQLAAAHGPALVRELAETLRCDLRSDAWNADGFLRDPDDGPAPPAGAWVDAWRPDVCGRATLEARLGVAADLFTVLLGWHAEAEGCPTSLALDLWAANQLFDVDADDPEDAWLYAEGNLVAYLAGTSAQRADLLALWANHEVESAAVALVGDCAAELVRSFFDGALFAVDDLLDALG